jgi:hypothetical protein
VCRRKPSAIHDSSRPLAQQNTQQAGSTIPTSINNLTGDEGRSASILDGVHGSRQASACEDGLAVSSAVSQRLFSAYFANIHSIWPILYTPMYDCGNINIQPDTFAPAVLYAVYAIAACVEPTDSKSSAGTKDKTPPPAVFFEAALLALQKKQSDQPHLSAVFHPLNFICPSIESCQTLVILALQQHGLGEASNAAMLCNTAAGMALELRLNEARPHDADYITSQIASRLWWNLYVVDKVLACGLGRPFALHSVDVTANYPSAAESDEFQLLQFRRASDGEVVRVKSHCISGFNLTIGICAILEDVLRATCSVTSKQRICKDFEAAEALRMSLWGRLQGCNEEISRSAVGLRTNGQFRPVVPPVAIMNPMVGEVPEGWHECPMISLARGDRCGLRSCSHLSGRVMALSRIY